MTCRHTSSIPQSVIDKAVDQWRTRLRACVKAKGHHFEHLLWISSWSNWLFSEPITGFRRRLHTESFIFVVNVYSGNV